MFRFDIRAHAAQCFGPLAKFLATFLLLAGTAYAIVFSFDYSGDSPGEGFNDPVLGQSRRAACNMPATYGAT